MIGNHQQDVEARPHNPENGRALNSQPFHGHMADASIGEEKEGETEKCILDIRNFSTYAKSAMLQKLNSFLNILVLNNVSSHYLFDENGALRRGNYFSMPF